MLESLKAWWKTISLANSLLALVQSGGSAYGIMTGLQGLGEEHKAGLVTASEKASGAFAAVGSDATQVVTTSVKEVVGQFEQFNTNLKIFEIGLLVLLSIGLTCTIGLAVYDRWKK